MAYARRRFGSYRAKGRTKRSAPRSRYTGRTRKRVSRRSYRPKKRMTRKSILNLTSQKKKDTMMSWTNLSNVGEVEQESPQDATLLGGVGQFYTICWSPTMRPGENFAGVLGTKSAESIRTNNTIFARGVKETIKLSTATSVGWQWRRVCFTSKDDQMFQGDSNLDTSPVARITSNGMVRLANQYPTETLLEKMFRGVRGEDWQDVTTAPIDTRIITVKYDRVRTIRSGNDSGVTNTYQMWHPMNKNLVYQDEEQGGGQFTSPISVRSKAGMGDYYIVDFFLPFGGSTTGDDLSFWPQSTFYWHEK